MGQDLNPRPLEYEVGVNHLTTTFCHAPFHCPGLGHITSTGHTQKLLSLHPAPNTQQCLHEDLRVFSVFYLLLLLVQILMLIHFCVH
jgi:hypothetical protein